MTVWRKTINLSAVWDQYRNGSEDFVKLRYETARVLRAAHWREITYLIDELAETQDVDEFDNVLSYIYDEADIQRVWIETR